MKAIAVTLTGIEPLAIEEIKQLIKTKAKKLTDGRILFETKTLKPLEKARTITKLYQYITHFTFKKEEDIYKKAKKTKIPIKKNFAVRCYREGKHDFKSKNVEVSLGEVIFKRGHKVNLEKPTTTVYAEIIQNTCIIGILYKKEMQKRKYKVRLNPASINACLAAAMIRLAETKPQHILVDPFCKDGVIIIEAALMGIKKVYGIDESMNNVKNARINAQLAKTSITISKAEVDWLDTKFEKHSVDRIITNPPFPARYRSKEEVEKITEEFMKQAAYILKKDGLLVFVSQNTSLLDQYAELNGFKKIKSLEPVIGNTTFSLSVLKPS
jgi:23S rRNA G2445 N2-methylase RlmL